MIKPTKAIYNFCLEDQYVIDDIENRNLFLNGHVDESAIDDLAYMILRFNRIDKGLDIFERKPITLYINSPGGNVTDGFGLIDVMLESETPVYTVNQGICYSMGFLIFLAGSKRYSMANSTYLCHDGNSMAWDSMSKLKDRMEFETVQMEAHIRNYILSRTKISEELYKKNYRKEWYFYPEEAKNIGVVTHIIGKDCKLSEIL